MGNYASAMSGPAMAIAIGYALKAPTLALFSLAAVGYAATAIIAADCGKAVSNETKADILVTPLVTILIGIGLSVW